MFLRIIFKKLWHKKLSSLLCILLMSFGVCIISLMILVGKDVDNKLRSNIKGIDMVIGAKGSPLQLILSAIYQLDSPTGNIKLKDLENISSNPLIKYCIPLSYGDNYNGYRIIGTNKKYFEYMQMAILSGKLPTKPFDVLLSENVATKLNIKLGDELLSSHGLDKDGDHHEDEKFIVKGIFKSSGSVIDNLIFTPLSSIWDLHHADSSNLEITAALVKFRSPMGLMTIPRMINQNTNMQAALPAIEIDRILKIFDYAIESIKMLAFLIVIISGVSVFISLYNNLKENKKEHAMLLAMGSSRLKIFIQLLFEGLFISVIGYLFGIILSRLILVFVNKNLDEIQNITFNVWKIESSEIYLLIVALLIGIFAAIIPALSIFNINISKNLAED
jgi:putative ABC transport system permease protein